MKIKLNIPYKSLNPFESEELANFTIITGKNGSGKSQLIEIIKEGSSFSQDSRIAITPKMSDCRVNSLNITSISSRDSGSWKNLMSNYYNNWFRISNSFWYFFFANNATLSFLEEWKRDKAIVKQEQWFNEYKRNDERWERNFNESYNQLFTDNYIHVEIKIRVAEYHHKNANSLNEMDYINTPFLGSEVDSKSLMNSSIENIFYAYIRGRHLNEYHWFRKKEFGENNNSIDPKLYISNNKAPWDVLNNLLEKSKIDFHFKDYPSKDFFHESIINFNLTKRSSNQKIDFNDLSTGEKTIISLVIRVFIISYYDSKLDCPDLIVLDEPDTGLHPEMTKLFIDVLSDIFVKDLKIKVIITTHNPSTIALAPDDSIYQLQNHPDTRLTKIHKDDALKLLTEFLPLNINYKNHRQVFVEGPTDLQYFSALFDKLNAIYKFQHKLYFITGTHENFNCDSVLKFVSELTKGDVLSCYGIIDWDEIDRYKENIIVHGIGSRTNIESFIFDPIFVSIYLLEKKFTPLFNHLGVDHTFIQYDLVKDISLMEKAIEFICKKLNKNFPDECILNESKDDVTYLYQGKSIKLKIPRWYLRQKAKRLKEIISDTFGLLKRQEGEDNYVKERELTTIMLKTSFIPLESYRLIKELASQ